jgi:anti-anti-sigma regulatory factor
VTRRKTARTSPAGQIELAAELTIAHAVDLQRALKERLSLGGALIIDATQVKQIDTAIMQLLVSSWRAAKQRGVVCSWAGVSDSMRRSAVLIGVAEFLSFPDSAAAS